MRSPFGMVDVYGPNTRASPHKQIKMTETHSRASSTITSTSTSTSTSTTWNNVGSFSSTPKVKSSAVASLSSFAAPSWGNNIGERNSNVRVVARIRPMDMKMRMNMNSDSIIMKSICEDNGAGTSVGGGNNENGVGNENTNPRVVFAISQEGGKDGIIGDMNMSQNPNAFTSPLKSPMSDISNSTFSTASTSVTSLTAKFNSPTSKPLVPDSSTIRTTTTLFSPTKVKTPIHANHNHHGTSRSSPGRTITSSRTSSPSMVQGGLFSPRATLVDGENVRPENISQTIAAGDQSFDLDAVIDTSATQDLLYRSAVGDAIRMNIFRGFNTCIIAYGQRGSGKTHTMYGPKKNKRSIGTSHGGRYSDDASIRSIDSRGGLVLKEDDGVVTRAIHDLFMAKAKQATASEVVITMNFIEISHDGIVDLLSSSSRRNAKKPAPPLIIRDNQNTEGAGVGASNPNGMPIKGLTSIRLKDANHARLILDAASRRRDHSRRSHTICTLHITMNPAVKSSITSGKLASMTSTDVISAKLTLVDLAGSERNRTDSATAKNDEWKEDASIKKDIFALGQCISALAANAKDPSKKQVVPYRDSKLTRLLRDSLGGNCCTVMIGCVLPNKKNIEDTLSTLRLAERARSIVNRIKKNKTKTKVLTPIEAAALRRENKVLKAHVLDLMKKVQYFIGEGNQSKVIFDFGGLELPSPSSGSMGSRHHRNHNRQDPEASMERNRWRLKYEKLAQLCKDANVSTDGAELSVEDENLLATHAFELNGLRDQISTLQKLQLQLDDGMSTTSCLTAETGDFNCEDEEISMLSLSHQSLKTCDYLEKSKNQHQEVTHLRVDEKQKDLEHVTLEGLLNTISEKESQIMELDRKREALQKKIELEEENVKAKIGQKKDSLLSLDLKLADGEKQLKSLQEEKEALKDAMERMSIELESFNESIEEKERKQNTIDIQILKLRAEIKSLHDEKLALFDLIEDGQNTADLVQELSEEKEARNKLQGKLDDVATSHRDLEEKLKIERASRLSEVGKRIDIETELKVIKGRVAQLEKQISEEKKIAEKLSEESETKEWLKQRSLPPLPSCAKKRKSKENRTCDVSSKKFRPADNSSVFSSSISVTGLLTDFKPDNGEDLSSVLLPQDDKDDAENMADFNSSFDNLSQQSVFSSGHDSMSSEQRAIRLHAQKLLFWADKAVVKTMELDTSSSSLCIPIATEDKENTNNASAKMTPRSVKTMNPNLMSRVLSPRNVSQKLTKPIASNGPLSVSSPSCTNTPQGKRCTCSNSIFSGNAEHAEFFLPRLGQACKCGALERSGLNIIIKEDPTALKSFLRTWQVSFLYSVGIYTAEDLLARSNSSLSDVKKLGKAMKKFRHVKKMKPARTKSCLIALQIWTKTAKMVLRSNQKNECRIVRSRSMEDDEGDDFSSSTNTARPSFMEIEVGDKDIVDEVSIMSMDDSLYEGEREI